MPVRVDEAGFEECSRVAGVAVAAYTLRALERWRANLGDYDAVMILVIAISSARLLRAWPALISCFSMMQGKVPFATPLKPCRSHVITRV